MIPDAPRRFCRMAIAAGLALALAAPAARSREKRESDGGSVLKTAGVIVLLEGLAALNSGMAAAAPKAYGAAGIVLSPLGLTGENRAADLAGISLFLGICVYDLTVPSARDLSRGQVFTHNMIGWHILFLGVGTAHLLTRDEAGASKERTRLGLAPTPGGAMVVFSRRF